MAVEWEHVMLTKRVDLDRSLDALADAAVRPAMAFGREGRQEFGVALIPSCRFEKRVQEAAGGGASPPRVGGHPEGLKDLPRDGPEFFPLGGTVPARAALLPILGFFW